MPDLRRTTVFAATLGALWGAAAMAKLDANLFQDSAEIRRIAADELGHLSLRNARIRVGECLEPLGVGEDKGPAHASAPVAIRCLRNFSMRRAAKSAGIGSPSFGT